MYLPDTLQLSTPRSEMRSREKQRDLQIAGSPLSYLVVGTRVNEGPLQIGQRGKDQYLAFYEGVESEPPGYPAVRESLRSAGLTAFAGGVLAEPLFGSHVCHLPVCNLWAVG